MHVLHLIRVLAPSHTIAEYLAEQAKYDWGTENNWSSICGSMREDGTVHSRGEGRYDPADYTLFTIKEIAINWCKGDRYEEERFYHLADKVLNNKPVEDTFLWYFAGRYCEYKLALGNMDWQSFDPWTQEFRSEEFDENGVTSYEPSEDTEIAFTPEEQLTLAKYLVFVDVHK